MTREEAIRILASSCIPGSKQTEALETLIPELAESEDERIRKAIIHYILYETKGAISEDTEHTWVKWLEKQKESLHIQESCKEKANSFTDGIIEVRSFQRGMEEGRRLEKQKEQKPVESISQLTVQGKGVYKICPRCKERMIRDDSMVYTSMPPQYRYECPKCGESECDTVMYDNPEMEEKKPAEWSEEDKRAIDRACVALRAYANGDLPEFLPSELIGYADRLQSLRPHWKPSEVCYGPKGDPDPAGTSDLEEAAEEYADGIIHLEDALMCKAAFIAGAEWQKGHLTVEDIKTILDLSFWNDDPEKILQEYNRLKK